MEDLEQQRARRLGKDGFDVLEHSDCTSEIAAELGLSREWNFLVQGGEFKPKTFDVINTNPGLRKEMMNEADTSS
jgi:hypothetical protein